MNTFKKYLVGTISTKKFIKTSIIVTILWLRQKIFIIDYKIVFYVDEKVRICLVQIIPFSIFDLQVGQMGSSCEGGQCRGAAFGDHRQKRSADKQVKS